MKLEPHEHWDEDPKQMEMWPDDREAEQRIITAAVVTTILIALVVVSYFVMH